MEAIQHRDTTGTHSAAMTHAHVYRAIGANLLGFQPEGRHLLLHLVSQDVQLFLLGLDCGLIGFSIFHKAASSACLTIICFR